MNAVSPVTFVTPDGVSRELRFTLGAQKRILERFGMPLRDALNKYDVGACPMILWALMHDSKGNPPDITAEELAESMPVEDGVSAMAAILSSADQGRKPKNELEAAIRMEIQRRQNSIGSISGASALNDSVFPTTTSGGDIFNAKSSPESTDLLSISGNGTSDSD